MNMIITSTTSRRLYTDFSSMDIKTSKSYSIFSECLLEPESFVFLYDVDTVFCIQFYVLYSVYQYFRKKHPCVLNPISYRSAEPNPNIEQYVIRFGHLYIHANIIHKQLYINI